MPASTSGRRWSTRCATRGGAATRRATPRTRALTGRHGRRVRPRPARRPPDVPAHRADAQALPRATTTRPTETVTSSNLPPRVLHEYELPAFRPAIAEGAAVAVMASYNLVNGRPAHLSPLINDELRRWTDDEILVVSDAQAPSNVAGVAGLLPRPRRRLRRRCSGPVSTASPTTTPTRAEPSSGSRRPFAAACSTESDVDTAVRRILTLRFRLGEFDPAELNPYAGVDRRRHQLPRAPGARPRGGPAGHRPAEEQRRPAAAGRRRGSTASPSSARCGDSLYEDWYSGTLPYAVTVRAGRRRPVGRQRHGDLRRGRRPARPAAAGRQVPRRQRTARRRRS